MNDQVIVKRSIDSMVKKGCYEMLECLDWEWEVIPCDCALKECMQRVATSHIKNDLYIQNLRLNEYIKTGQEVALLAGAADAAMLGYVECKLIAAGCMGTGETPRFTAREKLALGRASNESWNMGTAVGLVGGAVGVFFKPVLSLPFFGLAAYEGFHATNYSDLALDPPDPNFTTLAQPEQPVPPTILPESGIDKPTADALNDMLTNQAVCVGTGRAVVVSINRASGAEAANSSLWRDRQLEAARGFARAWSDELAKSGSLRSEAASQLGALGIGTTGLDILDVIRVVDDIVNNGWPQPVRDMLDRYGIRGAALDDALQRFTANLADLEALTASPIDMLTDTEHTSREEDAIAVIAHFGNG